MLELAEVNHWDPYPLPGFSFLRSVHTIFSVQPPRLEWVDYADFVLDFSLELYHPVPANSSLYFLSDGILLTDDLASNSLVFAFWILGPYPPPEIVGYVVCFTIPTASIPDDLDFQPLVVPSHSSVSSFRVSFPAEDNPVAPLGVSMVKRFVPEGEVIPVP
jgi:hypothetical protein